MKTTLFLTIVSIMLVGLADCNPNNKKTTVSDAEGNTYAAQVFDNQLWMIENLRTTSTTSGQPATTYEPGGNKNNIPDYGLLYDYETACTVCPKGWQLPAQNDWQTLIEFFDNELHSNMKDHAFWEKADSSVSQGIQIRPAGYGNITDLPNLFGKVAIVWSKTQTGPGSATALVVKQDTIYLAEQHMEYAFSVRCIKKD